jgi:hypothetical protein
MFPSQVATACVVPPRRNDVAIAGGMALFVSCSFLLYVLVQFRMEARRPRRVRQPQTDVVVLRRKVISRPYAKVLTMKHMPTQSPPNPPAIFPLGVRRLGIKRTARS